MIITPFSPAKLLKNLTAIKISIIFAVFLWGRWQPSSDDSFRLSSFGRIVQCHPKWTKRTQTDRADLSGTGSDETNSGLKNKILFHEKLKVKVLFLSYFLFSS